MLFPINSDQIQNPEFYEDLQTVEKKLDMINEGNENIKLQI
jgi:hypothetical protein